MSPRRCRRVLPLLAILAGSHVACGASSTGSPDAASPAGSTGDSGATKPGADAGSNPTGTSDAGSTGATPDENAWLVPMNQARAAVGETPLVWDPIAAKVAASYAALCNFAHNPDASSQYTALGGASSGLGENIAAGSTPEIPGDAVTSWLSEQPSYDHATNSCAAGQSCGHYTQIVWSTTTAVGCAHVSCTTSSPFNGFPDWDFNVCDFSPPGNYSGTAPY